MRSAVLVSLVPTRYLSSHPCLALASASALALALAVAVALSACERSRTSPTQAAATSTSSTSSTSSASSAAPSVPTRPAPAQSAPRVAKIVFVDKEHACECTRKRTEETWAAMQAALGTSSAPPPVERIHVDTQAIQAEKYTASKPLMVPPGIYFVDERNGVIDMLQGEVKTEQIAAVLN
ncbi:MAG: hypothetical protein V2A73_09105 [Pseudomonadota bacterium]